VFGGTDVNETDWEPAECDAMHAALSLADATVAFNEELRTRAAVKWPHFSGRLGCRVVPPSIEPPFGSSAELAEATAAGSSAISEGMARAGLPWESREEGGGPVLLLVSGIRAVKDPLFAVRASRHPRWLTLSEPPPRLVVLGPKRGCSYCDRFAEEVEAAPYAWYLPAAPQRDCHGAMLEAEAVLNVSKSEGAANAILEAMALGRPVLAKNIPGNASLVVDGETGLLFDTVEGFIDVIGGLLADKPLAERLGEGGRRRFQEVHSLEAEAAAYRGLVAELSRAP